MDSYLMECEFSNDHQDSFEGEEWRDAKELAEKRGWYFTRNNGIDYAMCPDCKRSLERDFALRFQHDVSQWFICELNSQHKRVYSGPSGNDMVERAKQDGWFVYSLGSTWQSICPDCVKELMETYRDTGKLPLALQLRLFADQLADYIEERLIAEANQEAAEQAGRNVVNGISLGIRSPSLEAIKLIQAQVSDAHYQAIEEAIRAELLMQLTPEEMAQVDAQAKAWAEAMADNTDAVHQAFEQVRDRLNPALLNDIERVGRQAAQDFQEAMNKRLSEQLTKLRADAFAANVGSTIRNLAPDQPNLTHEDVVDIVNKVTQSRLCSPTRRDTIRVSPYSFIYDGNPDCAFTPYQVQEQGETSNPEPHFFQAHGDRPQQEWRGLRNGFLTTYRDVDREDGSGERFPVAVRQFAPWFVEERWRRLGSSIFDADNNQIADATSAERTGNEDEETAQLFATAPALYRVLWALCVAYENGEEAEDMQPLFAEAAEVLGAATLVIPSVLVNTETGKAVTRKCLHPDTIDYLNQMFDRERLPLRWEVDEA